MRTKEVEKAIERLKNGKNTACFGGNTAIYFIKDVETALSYIEELEKITNEVDKQFIHKDRIYELTEEMNKQADSYNKAVDKFNKLLEE